MRRTRPCPARLPADVRRDVHHVAVALDAHHVAHFHAAIAAHSAHVVAAQIDQHHVLRPLLGIGQQLRGQPHVFLVGLAAAAGARQGPHRHPPVHHSDHHLGRAAHQRHAGRADIEHERAGVHHAKRAVDFERMRLDRHLQPLAEHDLEDVAGADVLHALFDRLLELRLGEVRWILDSTRRPVDIDRRQLAPARRELRDQGIDPPPSVVVGRLGGRPRSRSSRAIATTTIVLYTLSKTTMRS